MTQDSQNSDLPTLPPTCPKCNKGKMKRSNFRTGSVDKPKADVGVCGSCGYRIEVTPPSN